MTTFVAMTSASDHLVLLLHMHLHLHVCMITKYKRVTKSFDLYVER